MNTFTVTAERTPRGWWVLEAPEVGAVSQVRRLDQVADEMREAVAHLAGLAESEVELEVEPVLPADFVAARDLARARRQEADRLRDEAAAAHREAVRILSDRGYTVRDIGTLMDVSPQRVSQLTRA
ncbi:hypothetical protein [Piscicoccus intestinalis]|uniref:hypothetical protein n=1 Tax=Piscicoccus intestinalis TaxID=746033 RepID=UPI00083963B5|nr:hypothetical protein [Piscicoccus intestinalis]